MADKYLTQDVLEYFWNKIKSYGTATFSSKEHTHPSGVISSLEGYSKAKTASPVSEADTLNAAIGKIEAGLDEAVHKSGNENVSGTKTFSAAPVVKASAVDKSGTENASETESAVFYVKDASNASFAQINAKRHDSEGINELRLRGTNAGGKWADLRLQFSDDNTYGLYLAGSGGMTSQGFLGNASTASALKTARKLKADLSATADAPFDGSADQTAIPVQGVLPASKGGTGLSTLDSFVRTTGTQEIGGEKTFTEPLNASITGTAAMASADADGNAISTTYAKAASAALTGTPTAPNPSAGDSSTRIATTKFVSDAIAAQGIGAMSEAIEDQADQIEGISDALDGKLDSSSSAYLKSISIDGTQVTVVKGDGSSETMSTQDRDTHWTTKAVVGAADGTTSSAADNPYLRIFDNNTARATFQISGSGAASVSSDSLGNITVSSTDTTYGEMSGASQSKDGTSGLVPAPESGDAGKFLRGDGSWALPEGVDPASAAPLASGTASVGTSLKYAREDHIHPEQEKISAVPEGTTYVAGASAGKALVTSETTSYGAVFNAPTKTGRVSLGTNPSSNDLVSLMSFTSENVASGTNEARKTLTWNASDGTLTVDKIVADIAGDVTGNVTGSSGSCTGNAATASKFAASQTISLSGDVSGSASSQAGWSISTSLKDVLSGTGSFGPDNASETPAHGASFKVPYVTVDSKGRVTAISNRMVTLPASGNTDVKVRQETASDSAERPLLARKSVSDASGTANYAAYDTGVTVNASTHKVTASGGFVGDLEGTAESALTVPWSGIEDRPSTFAPAEHSHSGSDVALTGYAKASSASAVSASDSVSAAIGKLEKALDGKQAAGNYASASHTQASSTINAMTGYSKPSSTGAIGTSDTLNSAIGKLEKALDGKASSSHSHPASDVTLAGYSKQTTAAPVDETDSVYTAIGKLEKALDGKQAAGSYAASSHTQASSTINVMTGYSKPSSTSAIAASDTLNAAIGKLEKALDGKQAAGSYAASSHNQASNTINAMTGYAKASSAGAISTSDTLNSAIGKLEKALDGKQASGSYAASSHTHSSSSVTAMTDYAKASSAGAISTSDTLNEAIGKLEKALDGKANTSHGTHVSFSTDAPKAAGTASAGGSSTTTVAKSDHVHPLQTSVSGNAGTATKFSEAQTVELRGAVTGSASSQAGWTVTTTLADSGVTADTYGSTAQQTPAHGSTFSIPYVTVDAKGRVTAAGTSTVKLPADSNTDTKVNVTLGTTTKAYLLGTSTTPTSTAAGVTAVSDTGVYLDTTAGRLTAGSFAGNGQNITLATANAIVTTDANKKLTASTSITATELGYLDGVTSSIQTQLNGKAASSHSHDASDISSGTLDAARIPSLDASKITSGTIDIARLPAGALERLVIVDDETKRFALTTATVQLGDTVKQADTGRMYYVVDTDKLDRAAGYEEYTAGSATSVPWSGVTGKPSTFAPAAHNQASNTINAMTGYSKPSSTSAIGTSDTLNTAIGKLEKALDGKQASGSYASLTHSHTGADIPLTGYAKASSASAVAASDSTNAAIGKLEKALDGKAATTHSQTSSTINAMTGYSKPSSTSAISANDTLNAAIGKLEKALDGKQASGSYASASHTQASSTINAMTGYAKASAAAAIAETDTLNAAIGKLEKALDGKQASGSYLTSSSSLNAAKLTGTAAVNTTGKASTAGTADQVASSLTLKVKSGTTEGTDLYTFNGSGAKTLDIKQGSNVTLTAAEGSLTIAAKDTVYTHPTTSGSKHVPSGGSSGQFLGWDSDGTAKWVSNPNTDTKNTAGSTNTSSKIFLVGATSQAANPQTYSHDTAYVGTDGCLYSGGTKVLTAHQSLANYVTLNSAQTISGAKTFTGEIIGINKNDATDDANDLYSTSVGSKLTYYTTTNGSTKLTNVPAAVNTTLESRTIRRLSDSDWIVEQICHNSNGLYYRKGNNGTWSAWKTFAFTDSNITGNAATVTGTAGTSALSWNTETTLYTVGGHAIKAKLPANPNTDTKNTAGSTDTSSKIFLVGATSQAANPQTYSHDTAYVGTDGCLYSGGTKVLTAHQTLPTLSYTESGSGNAITGISVSNHAITATKGSTFLTSHQSLANYVTLNGAQTISAVKTFTAKPVLNQVGLDMTVKDTTEGSTTTRTSQVLHANSSNSSYGINIAFCSGGNAVVGGGEAGTAQLNALAGNSGEDLYLVADGNIYLKPNGNTWANAKTITLNTAGELSGLAKVTSTSFVGSLTGNATTVTGTAGTSTLAWNSEVTLYTVGGNAIKAKLPANPNTDTKVRQDVGTTNTERPILSRYNVSDASQTAGYAVYDTGVTNNPNKHTLTASGGFVGKLSGTPEGTTFVAAVTEGKALVNATTTGYGGIWNAPTKNYRVGCSTHPSSGDDVRIAYSVTNANVTAGTNTVAKSLTWNADSGTLTATAFSGPLTGNVTGNVSGSSGSCTGNAATATKLATARTINGVSFDGSANITVADSTKVAKAGDTMTGNLTISKAGPVLCTKSTGMTRNTAPSAAVNTVEILGQDNAGKSTWGIYHTYGTDMANRAQLIAYNGKSTDNTWSGIGIGYDASGNVSTNAPTPAFGDNTTKIATTAFVYNNAAKHLSAATSIYVAKAATGNGSGSSTSNYMALADLRDYLATVHMHSSTADLNGSYALTILFKAGDSFGNATFDAAKMPGIRNLVLNTSTGTASTTSNYSTNSPTFGNLYVTGDISVTIRNINCTGRISAQYGAYVAIDTYVGLSSLHASNWAYVSVAKNMVIDVCDAHTDYLFAATNSAILAMWPGATVTINFRQQCWYTRCLFMSSNNGSIYVGYSSFKLTGTKPVSIWAGTGTLTGTSETAAGTAAKVVPLADGQTFTLAANATAKVRFTNDNTAANPTLNINSTGAKAIWWNGAAVAANMLAKNMTYDVKYDGTHYVIQNAIKRLTNNDYGVFRYSGNYETTYNSGSWNFSDWTPYYGTGLENSTFRGSHIGSIEQRVASDNYTYPILFSGTANATATTSTVPYFDVDVKINPSTSTIYASTFSGALSGNASTATKLATGRSLKTKLDSTTAVTFDGSGAQDAIPVTGTLPIANGGTGATTRLNALKALTNEDVGSNANYFLTITTSWGKGGYTSVANAKTVLGLKSAAYTESSAYATSSHALSVTNSGDGNAVTGISVNNHSITVLKSLDFATAGHTHSYLPLTGGTMTGNITMSASKSIIFDLSATTPTASTVRNFPIQFKSQSTSGNFAFAQNPFFEIPLEQTTNYGMGIGFSGSGLTIIGGGEAGRGIVEAESLTGGTEKIILASDGAIDFFTNCNTIANRVKTTIDTAGNFSGNAATATKLKTARTINGVSFDGSANITVADSTKVAKAGDTMSGVLTISKSGEAMFHSKSTGNSTAANNWECMIGIGSSGKGGLYDNTRGYYIIERAPTTGVVTIIAKKDDKSATGTYTFGTDGKLTATTFAGALSGNASSATITKGNKGTGSYVTSVKSGNALVNADNTQFGTIFNAPTKNYRVGCATWPDSNDNIVFYSITNANVSNSTNTVNKTMTWNGDTGVLSATGFSGPLTGNVTGNCSGSSGSCTGNAATATTLKTARNINGVAFDGSANITVADSTKLPLSGGTVTGAITNKHTGLVKGSAVSAWTCRDYRVIDNSGDSGDKPCLSWWRTAVGTDKKVSVTINAFKFADESTASASIGIHYPVDGDAYTSAPTPPTADNSTKIATTAFVKAQGYITGSGNAATATKLATARNINGVAFDGSANITVADSTKLPLAGGTMTGNIVDKRSGPCIYFQNTDFTKGTKPSGTKYSTITFTDSAGTGSANRTGMVESYVDANGKTCVQLGAYKYVSGSTAWTGMGICYDADGSVGYTYAPTPAASDNSTKIATTAYVTTKCGNYLPLAGGNMTGSITLTDKSIIFDNSTLDYNAAPSANVTQGGLYWRDKNDKYVARMLYYKNTDKTMGMSFGMCKHGTTNSDGYTTLLGMSMNADGSVKYASCPTPAAGDSSTKIATTAFVASKFHFSTSAPSDSTGANGDLWYQYV